MIKQLNRRTLKWAGVFTIAVAILAIFNSSGFHRLAFDTTATHYLTYDDPGEVYEQTIHGPLSSSKSISTQTESWIQENRDDELQTQEKLNARLKGSNLESVTQMAERIDEPEYVKKTNNDLIRNGNQGSGLKTYVKEEYLNKSEGRAKETASTKVLLWSVDPNLSYKHDTMSDFDMAIKKRFEERMQKLKSGCNEPKYKNRTIKHIRDNDILYFIPSKLHACLIPKVGTSFMKHLQRSIISPSQSKSNASNELGEAKTFFLVREPYSRMVSGYLGKIVSNQPWWDNYGRYIVKRFRQNPSSKDLRCGSDVSFPEFIKYVIHAQETGEYKNLHFMPIFEQCRFCERDYDYIGHLETIYDDLGYMLKVANISVNLILSYAEYYKLWGKTSTIISQRSKIQECENMCDILRRTWWTLQVRGLVSNEIDLPLTCDQCNNVTDLEFFDIAREAYLASEHMDTSKQKREALVKLYEQVLLEDRLKLKEVMSGDFEMFGYDPQPADIFPELSTKV